MKQQQQANETSTSVEVTLSEEALREALHSKLQTMQVDVDDRVSSKNLEGLRFIFKHLALVDRYKIELPKTILFQLIYFLQSESINNEVLTIIFHLFLNQTKPENKLTTDEILSLMDRSVDIYIAILRNREIYSKLFFDANEENHFVVLDKLMSDPRLKPAFVDEDAFNQFKAGVVVSALDYFNTFSRKELAQQVDALPADHINTLLQYSAGLEIDFFQPSKLLALSPKNFYQQLEKVPAKVRYEFLMNIYNSWSRKGFYSEKVVLANWLLRYPAFVSKASDEVLQAFCVLQRDEGASKKGDALADLLLDLNDLKQFDALQHILQVVIAENLYSEGAMLPTLSARFDVKALAVLVLYSPRSIAPEMLAKLPPSLQKLIVLSNGRASATELFYRNSETIRHLSQVELNEILDILPNQTRIDVLFGIRDYLLSEQHSDAKKQLAQKFVIYLMQNLSATHQIEKSRFGRVRNTLRKSDRFLAADASSVHTMTRWTKAGEIEPLLNAEVAKVCTTVLPEVLQWFETNNPKKRKDVSETLSNLTVQILEESDDVAENQASRSFLLRQARAYQASYRKMQEAVAAKKQEVSALENKKDDVLYQKAATELSKLETEAEIFSETARELLTQTVLTTPNITPAVKEQITAIDQGFLSQLNNAKQLSAESMSTLALLSKHAPEFIAETSLQGMLRLLGQLHAQNQSLTPFVLACLNNKDTIYEKWLAEADTSDADIKKLFALVGTYKLFRMIQSYSVEDYFQGDNVLHAFLLIQLLKDQAFIKEVMSHEGDLSSFVSLLGASLFGYVGKRFKWKGQFIEQLVENVLNIKSPEYCSAMSREILLETMLTVAMTKEHLQSLVGALDVTATFSILNSKADYARLPKSVQSDLLLHALGFKNCLVSVADMQEFVNHLEVFSKQDIEKLSAAITKLDCSDAEKCAVFAETLVANHHLFDVLSLEAQGCCACWLSIEDLVAFLDQHSSDVDLSQFIATQLSPEQKEGVLSYCDSHPENSRLVDFIIQYSQLFFGTAGDTQRRFAFIRTPGLLLKFARQLRKSGTDEVRCLAVTLTLDRVMDLKDAEQIAKFLDDPKNLADISNEQLVVLLWTVLRNNMSIDFEKIRKGLNTRKSELDNAAVINILMRMVKSDEALRPHALELFEQLVIYWMRLPTKYQPLLSDVLELFDREDSLYHAIANELFGHAGYQGVMLSLIRAGQNDKNMEGRLANALNATSKELTNIILLCGPTVVRRGSVDKTNMSLIDYLKSSPIARLLSKEKAKQLSTLEAIVYKNSYKRFPTLRRFLNRAGRWFRHFGTKKSPLSVKRKGVLNTPTRAEGLIATEKSVVVILDRLSQYGISCESEKSVTVEGQQFNKETFEEIIQLMKGLCAYCKSVQKQPHENQSVLACLIYNVLQNMSNIEFEKEDELNKDLAVLRERQGSAYRKK